jgi:hypothetical protein
VGFEVVAFAVAGVFRSPIRVDVESDELSFPDLENNLKSSNAKLKVLASESEALKVGRENSKSRVAFEAECDVEDVLVSVVMLVAVADVARDDDDVDLGVRYDSKEDVVVLDLKLLAIETAGFPSDLDGVFDDCWLGGSSMDGFVGDRFDGVSKMSDPRLRDSMISSIACALFDVRCFEDFVGVISGSSVDESRGDFDSADMVEFSRDALVLEVVPRRRCSRSS